MTDRDLLLNEIKILAIAVSTAIIDRRYEHLPHHMKRVSDLIDKLEGKDGYPNDIRPRNDDVSTWRRAIQSGFDRLKKIRL